MIYSIGHSTLSAEDFFKAASPVGTVIDVRSHPTSRWEQFRRESLELWLPEGGKGYEWEPGLGGWAERHAALAPEFEPRGVAVPVYARGKFPKQRIALGTKEPTPAECLQGTLPCVRPEWTNVGLRDYSWFMTLPEFLDAADALIERGKSEDVAIMCAEVLWWKCHRSMVADYLVFRGADVVHLQPKPTLHSKSIGNRLERYDPEILEAWRRRTLG